MEHNTDRILWTVLILAIGIALYVIFRPDSNDLLHQGVEKIQTVETNVNSNTSDNSSNSGSSSNTTVGANLLTGTAKCEFPFNTNYATSTIQKYDDETNYIQSTINTPTDWIGTYWYQVTPEVGQVYTLSADVSGNGYITGIGFRYEDSNDGSLNRVDLNNNWQRISSTFSVNRIYGAWVIYANNSTSLKVKHIKIEKGSTATPWVP